MLLSCEAIALNGQALCEVTVARDLGVLVDTALQFSNHCEHICKAAYRQINLIFRALSTNDLNTLLLAYKTYVRPGLEYAAQVWSPHLVKDIDLVERVQAYYTRRLMYRVGAPSNMSYSCRLIHFNLESLELRRLYFDLTFLFKMISGEVSLRAGDYFQFSNLNRNRILIPLTRHETRHSSFFVRVIAPWNSLPEPIVTALSSAAFKVLVRKHNLQTFLRNSLMD